MIFFLIINLGLVNAKELEGISFVITLPAPILEFLFILIGATKEQLEPTNTLFSIIVLCLFLPSKLQVIVPAPIFTFLPKLLSPI